MPRSRNLRFRRGTAAQWAAANPILAAGEPGYETDTRRLFIGDGVSTYSALTTANQANILYIGADEMGLVTGAPSFSGTGVTGSWLLDAAATEGVSAKRTIPDHWATFNVTVRFMNAVAAAGDVALRCDISSQINGAIPARTVGSVVIVTASATQFLITESTLITGFAVPADKRVHFTFNRVGADVGDTLANDIGLIDARLIRAT